jgi:hypothetical protein
LPESEIPKTTEEVKQDEIQNEDTEEEKTVVKLIESPTIEEPIVDIAREFIVTLTNPATPNTKKRQMLMEYKLL